MKPLEIFEYKNRWKPGYVVSVHSDKESVCVKYCKENFQQHIWAYERFTDVYSHSYMFEYQNDAYQFMSKFEDSVVL